MRSFLQTVRIITSDELMRSSLSVSVTLSVCLSLSLSVSLCPSASCRINSPIEESWRRRYALHRVPFSSIVVDVVLYTSSGPICVRVSVFVCGLDLKHKLINWLLGWMIEWSIELCSIDNPTVGRRLQCCPSVRPFLDNLYKTGTRRPAHELRGLTGVKHPHSLVWLLD